MVELKKKLGRKGLELITKKSKVISLHLGSKVQSLRISCHGEQSVKFKQYEQAYQVLFLIGMKEQEISNRVRKIMFICYTTHMQEKSKQVRKQICPKQFAQLYTVHVFLRSAHHDTKVYAVLFAHLLYRIESTYLCLFTILRKQYPFWLPKFIKLDFETTVSATRAAIFPDTTISGWNFHFNQSGGKYKIFG